MDKIQEQYLQDSLNRGEAFSYMITTDGWKFIKAMYEAKIQAFANGLLLGSDKEIAEFEKERQRIIGIRQLFTLVENDIKTLNEQSKASTTTGE